METSEGSISFTKNVIGKIVVESVKKYNGKVLISNQKGKVPGIVRKIGGMDDINNMEIAMGPMGLDVRVFVVIHFGTSIGYVTNNLIEDIYNQIKEYTDLEPNSVAIVVTGIISKQQISRRNIEVKR